MKFPLILAATLSFFVTTSIYAAETKTVCVDRKDKAGKIVLDKSGKAVQDCKTIKVHKKLEGTKVPEKAGK
jgi:capsular polysaccharide biosynthesis protein